MFQKQVENQFESKIKVFQCDGGGEFISHRFKAHLQNCGIKQSFSCPYTPAQNGIAERKHRHIVELGLAMLYHGRIPLKYWVDAFITANYVINLLPTPKLDMQSPHRKLYHQEPTYDHLRVFGCACYPCLRPYAQHKFDPRSLTCVFIGYSDHHKGYRCLVPSTGRIYITRNVKFDEKFFPFTKWCLRKYASPTTLYQTWVKEVQLTESANRETVSNILYNDPHTAHLQLDKNNIVLNSQSSQQTFVPYTDQPRQDTFTMDTHAAETSPEQNQDTDGADTTQSNTMTSTSE